MQDGSCIMRSHTDGLLKGCEIQAEDGRLVIGKGMLKFHDFIYLMMEEEEGGLSTEEQVADAESGIFRG